VPPSSGLLPTAPLQAMMWAVVGAVDRRTQAGEGRSAGIVEGIEVGAFPDFT
jgi:hypothetical protein